METPLNQYDIAKVREAFPALKELVYLNVGTYGIMPEPALAEFLELLQQMERGTGGGSRRRGVNAWSGTEDTRHKLANLIGSVSQEIAFTRNATDGINLVLAGIDWKAGDEVITTEQEHEAMNHPLMYLQKTKGIKARFLPVSPKADVMLEALEKVVNPKTRLVAMSYITCETGTRLPAKEICKWAQEHNLLTLFDGAQASGAFPIKVRDIGCDFYASNGHKWLCGPKGTGFFFSKMEKVNELSPAHVGAGSLERVDLVDGTAIPFQSSQRFEFGTRAWGLTAGLGFSLDWYESLGWHNVYNYIVNLTGYFKKRILEKPYLELLTPVEFNESSGLTSFVFKGRKAGEISAKLGEKGKMVVRVVPHYNCIRISTAHFVSEGDIDKLMDVLDMINRGEI
jgi:selenocysteine lyase/cysteine desulfurase